jgi:hydroxymethylglutaryl-CoA lyase
MLGCKRSALRALSRKFGFRSYATAANVVNIVEVGPRDGLQNEKGVIPVSVKAELVTRLGRAGVEIIEAGSFVSPKWVPQVRYPVARRYMPTLRKMAGTAEVLAQAERFPNVRYPVLVPNQKGLDAVTALLAAHPVSPPLTDEISIFTAATDAFTRANLNVSTLESLERLAPVARAALDQGLRVRGYVSVVIACPYSGQVDYVRVRDVAKALIDMGCYEVSLGDTVGMGTPRQVSEMLEEVKKSIPVANLAVGLFIFRCIHLFIY